MYLSMSKFQSNHSTTTTKAPNPSMPIHHHRRRLPTPQPLQLLRPRPKHLLCLPLPRPYESYLPPQLLQPPRQRRLLGNLQRAKRIQTNLLLLERFCGLGDLLAEGFGTLLVAAVVEGEFLFELIAFFGGAKDRGLEGLGGG